MSEPTKEQQDLAAYIDGELDPAERERIEQEIASDPELKRQVDQWRRMDEAPGGLEPAPVSELQWQQTWQGIHERMTGGHAAAPGKRGILRLVIFAAAAAAVLVVAVTFFSIRQRRLMLPKFIAETAPAVEKTEPGEGFKAVEIEFAEDTLRIDYEPTATGE